MSPNTEKPIPKRTPKRLTGKVPASSVQLEVRGKLHLSVPPVCVSVHTEGGHLEGGAVHHQGHRTVLHSWRWNVR